MNTSINFTSFTSMIQERVQAKLGSEYRVTIRKVKKNNGIELTGLIAQKKECNASPAVYLNDFYKKELTEQEILKIADELYEGYCTPEFGQTLDLSSFLDFKRAKGLVTFKLIHAQQNRELLKEIPYRLYLNLAIVYYYTVQEAPFNGKASILIYNSHMTQWQTTEAELFAAALVNTPRLLPWKLENMENVMRDLLSDSSQKERTAEKIGSSQSIGFGDEELFPMYVLSNHPKLLGAACILYPGVLQECEKALRGSFYVLPSSVHEVILMPESQCAESTQLLEIVTEINQTQVPSDEVLADSVYFYNQEQKQLTQLF